MRRKTLVIHDKEFDDYEAACVSIDETDINAEFIRLPADLAYWVSEHAQASKDYLRTKAKLSVAKAAVGNRRRQAGKITEAGLKDYVSENESIVMLTRELNRYESEKIRTSGIVEAIRTKRDCLISLGAQVRAERDTTSLSLKD